MIVDFGKQIEYVNGHTLGILGGGVSDSGIKSVFTRALPNVNSDKLLNSTGISISFQTDSSYCNIRFKFKNLYTISQNIGLLLVNGINYIVYEKNRNSPIVQNSVNFRNNSLDNIFNLYQNTKRLNLSYEIYLPSFNEVTDFVLEIEDDATILPIQKYNKNLIFLGGNFSIGDIL